MCLGEIRADPVLARTPVFMVSATPAREIITRVAQMGVSGIILKNDKLLPQLIERLLAFGGGGPIPAKQPVHRGPRSHHGPRSARRTRRACRVSPCAGQRSAPAAPPAPAHAPAGGEAPVRKPALRQL